MRIPGDDFWRGVICHATKEAFKEYTIFQKMDAFNHFDIYFTLLISRIQKDESNMRTYFCHQSGWFLLFCHLHTLLTLFQIMDKQGTVLRYFFEYFTLYFTNYSHFTLQLCSTCSQTHLTIQSHKIETKNQQALSCMIFTGHSQSLFKR